MEKNLINILSERSKLKDIGITYVEDNSIEEFISYQKLHNLSLQVLAYFQELQIQPKDEIVFQLDDNKIFTVVFWACILGGYIPIPLTVGRNDDHRNKFFNVWEILNNPYLIISCENLEKLEKHATLFKNYEFLNVVKKKRINAGSIFSSKKNGRIHNTDEKDIAYVQFSSGSTGNPKGVILTHQNLITNAKSIIKGIKSPESGDKFFSWMPLTHDMGLIGFHITPLIAGWQQYLMPTELFIRRPSLWLHKIDQHKITFTASPNFGYRYVLDRFDEVSSGSLNVSSLRLLANGAEPISGSLCKEFTEKFTSYGLCKNTIFPVYGLAEASLAVTLTKPHDEVLTLTLKRDKLNQGDIIEETKYDNGVSFVNVGSQVENCYVRIFDDSDNQVSDNIVGRIKIKGENVTQGYYNNPKSTKLLISIDGWLDTSDLGFMRNNCLYIIGRVKDVIFINGQNYYSHDIERNLEIIEAVELGKVVVAGYTNKTTGKEEVIIFVLHKGKIEKFIETYKAVKKHVNQFFGFEPDHIIPIRKIPKTTSGKIQRFKLIEEYYLGKFNREIQDSKDLLALQGSNISYIEPVNETERKLFEIWSNVLQHKNFGITHKFFEIGGNSLKGAHVLSVIHKEFRIDLDFSLLFEKQTIQEIALEIQKHEIVPYKAISKIKEQDYYPLSSVQRRLYYLWEIDKTSIAYNVPVAFFIKGRLDIEKLRKAIMQLVQENEILRSSFHMIYGAPYQHIIKKIELNLLTNPVDLNNIKNELKKRVKPFDLNKPPLLRIELLNASEYSYFLFLDFHHIIFDGVSFNIFFDNLFRIYQGKKINEPDIQYKDYVNWEKNIKKEKFNRQAQYWLQQYKDDVPIINLPVDFIRSSLIEHRGEKIEFTVDKEMTIKLKEFAKQENISLFALLFAGYNILLSKYSGQEDIVVGVPVAGRNHNQVQSVIGMFVNNLAIRSYPKGNLTVRNFLSQMQSSYMQGLSNTDYPFEALVEELKQKRDVSRNSIFDTMFIFQNMEFLKYKDENISVEHFFFDPGFSKYDISLEVFDEKEEIKYFIEYSTSLFQKDSIIRIGTHYGNLLNNIIKAPNTKLSDVTIMNNDEYDAYILGFNKTVTDYPRDKVIHQLIEAQALKTPDAIAVVVGNKQVTNLKLHKKEKGQEIQESDFIYFYHQLTYKELNEKSNQLANFLKKKGIVSNIPVAIILDRSPELVIAILGILKAGGCYLPIDKDLPYERIKYILANSQTKFMITDTNFNLQICSFFATCSLQCDIFDVNLLIKYSKESIKIANINAPNDLAYIIYTSGTTSNPKGVMVEHQSLVNYISFANKTYIKGEKTSFPLYTSISFDLTITSIFTPLISGNTIVVYPDNEKSLPLEDVLYDNQIQILKATPSHLKILKEYRMLKEFDYFSNIKRLIVGGEVLTTQLARYVYDLFNEKVEIYNEYGPTEATVGCMIYKYNVEKDKRQTVPIGIPVDNTQIYLLNKYLKPVSVGVIGEIYISGDSLSRGYLFNPQLTGEKFIANPFGSNQQMYKTGDLGKRLPDGNIEFIGRIDKQIKINGYRIEIEEIEQVLLEHQEVKEVVVVYKDESIYAYVVLDENENHVEVCGDSITANLLTINDQIIQNRIFNIKQHLLIHLPHYMLPKHIIIIDSIPLTKNGKVNYSLLSNLEKRENVKTKATNNIQQVMISIWQDVFNETQIGITDNFFELGGDSIKAVQIVSKLFNKNISVNVKDILTYQTIEQLCLYAEITDGDTQHEQGIVDGEIELSPVQRWFFEQNFKNPHFYNQSILLKLKKTVDKEILQKTFQILIKHHDGLRVNYNPEKRVMFYNNDYLDEEFIVEEYPCKPIKNEAENWNWELGISDFHIIQICQKLRNSFIIENTLLIKAGIIKGNRSDLLFITAHHLIIDGVSWRILLEDFYSVYNSLIEEQDVKLLKKTASLIEWSKKLLDLASSKELKNQIEYWEEENTYLPPSFSPIPFLPTPLTNEIRKVSFKLDKNETEFLLTDANKPYNTNIEILLASALIMTLRYHKNSDEVVIEIERHGRHLKNDIVSRTVGWFTSMFPIKFKIDHNDLGEVIKHVKEKIRTVPDEGYGYGVLKYMNQSLPANSEISEVRFNYLGQFENELNNDLFEYEPSDTGLEISNKNHLTTKTEINAMVINNELYVEISSIEEHCHSFLSRLQNNLDNIIIHVKNEDEICFTPSDFDGVELDEEDLNSIFK
jgi:surfactin family lipopeptide synthetase A